MSSQEAVDVIDPSSLEGRYASDAKTKIAFMGACAILIFIIAGIALSINGRDLGFLDSYSIILDHILGRTYELHSVEWIDDYMMWNVYLPRIIMGISIGAGLAICGVAMQSVMNNPLADSYTTGVSDGACFGAVAAIVTGFTFSSTLGSMGIMVNAFIGGLIPAFILIGLSNAIRMSPATMILVGIALSYIFSGMETTMMVTTDADTLKNAYLWQIGSLGDIVSWDKCLIPTCIVIVSGLVLWACSSRLNLLALGDDSAKSLGLDVRTFKTIVMLIASLSVAVLVSYVGIIGFIGLVAPHIARMILGGDNRYVIPASALIGAMLVLIADLIARTVISPDELRVGVVISMIGAPVFLYLILSKKKSYGEVFRWSSASRLWRSGSGIPTDARSPSQVWSWRPPSAWHSHRSSSPS